MALTKGAKAILKLWPWLVPEGCEAASDHTVAHTGGSMIRSCACCGRRYFVPSPAYAKSTDRPLVHFRRLWFVETSRKHERNKGSWDDRQRMKDIFECCYRKATGRRLPRSRQ